MGWAFLGGFLAVGIGIAIIVYVVRKRIRSFSSEMFGNPDLLSALKEIDTDVSNTPRSLNGCDKFLLPQILKDFPDFDVGLAKTYAREALAKKLRSKEDVHIYNVVIANYRSSSLQKTIIFQAAVAYREKGERLQKRFDMHYTYLLAGTAENVAANCPNCGGVLVYGQTQCSYCGSRVANILGNTWEFTEIKES